MCWPLAGRSLSPEPDVAVPHPRLGVPPALRSFLSHHSTPKDAHELSTRRNDQELGNQLMRTRLASVTRDSQSPDELQPLPSINSPHNLPLRTGTSEAVMGSRLPEVVDLTSSTPRRNPITLSSSPLGSSFASSSQNGGQSSRGTKRPREEGRRRTSSSSSDIWLGREAIETIDMTEDPDAAELAKAVSKQREDAVKAQRSTENKDITRTALMAYTCPICMDTPVDATATSCGHLFCHKCIMEYLTITEETRADSSKQSKGTCPVCRKPLSRKDQPGRAKSLIPLQFKLHTKTRSELEAARAAARK